MKWQVTTRFGGRQVSKFNGRATASVGGKEKIRDFNDRDDAMEFYGDQVAAASQSDSFITHIALFEIDDDGFVEAVCQSAYARQARTKSDVIEGDDPVIPFGKNKGKHFSEVHPLELDYYLTQEWVWENTKAAIRRFLDACPAYKAMRHQAPQQIDEETPARVEPVKGEDPLETPAEKQADAARREQLGTPGGDFTGTNRNGRERPFAASQEPTSRLPVGNSSKENAAAHQRAANRALNNLEKEIQQKKNDIAELESEANDAADADREDVYDLLSAKINDAQIELGELLSRQAHAVAA